ncbi:PCMD domain-containing protein [Myroides phaeus]|uniref:Carbohydrate metabolism domain-containing protein n=1 Tax=Myroides phaeus TaxID=702745 RepID=A0A1G8B143_9FLAO|nr:PCMD domain-containing protein [Myroides phaeus]MEC4115754.1 PCMD domain-containing protein [Myroides phaeus]SDH26350.1 Putative carbohydrate metabolism domain-containing protein [Myroides phaeus]
MRKILIISSLFMAALVMGSCYKDEELDTNADILEAYIPSEYLKTDPIITNTSIEFKVKSNTDLRKQSPFFIISPNATMDPPNGTTRDFSNAQKVTITAQDPTWKKTYLVSFTTDELSTSYTFNNAELTNNNRYYRFFEYGSNGEKIYDWDSGNAGYVTIAGNLPPESYPTTTAPGRNGGLAVNMQTVYTSPIAEFTKSPIAAGNLFIGSFQFAGISRPLKSTRFGLPYEGDMPKSLRGFFKYKAGDVVTDKYFNPVTGKKDYFDIYAILFESRDKENYLDGTHKFKDPRNVAIARVPQEQRIETDKWTEFEVPFEFVNGKKFDPTKSYVLAIVMTSSIEGDEFTGAIGSTLIVDEIELVYDNK